MLLKSWRFILLHYKRSMSGMLASVKNFSITRYVMADDVDDIQDPGHHMSRPIGVGEKLFHHQVRNG